ncbi:hypothetical protein HAX54_043801 [Datura stramonium]|uniref:Uncharacterized protein n=1 Tax=Datura stramonium TaxID=4076 RepID=A0ABS8W469_DATST|nr:hypothetical protein [Datura stramonium]
MNLSNCDEEFKGLKESISSSKAETALSRFITERTESELQIGSPVDQQVDLLSNIVEQNNNNAEELMNKKSLIDSVYLKYDVVAAERDQLKPRVAMIDEQLNSKDDQI